MAPGCVERFVSNAVLRFPEFPAAAWPETAPHDSGHRSPPRGLPGVPGVPGGAHKNVPLQSYRMVCDNGAHYVA